MSRKSRICQVRDFLVASRDWPLRDGWAGGRIDSLDFAVLGFDEQVMLCWHLDKMISFLPFTRVTWSSYVKECMSCLAFLRLYRKEKGRMFSGVFASIDSKRGSTECASDFSMYYRGFESQASSTSSTHWSAT